MSHGQDFRSGDCARTLNSRSTSAWRTRGLLALLAAVAIVPGCGGSKDMRVWLGLSEGNKIPVFVGVYYLSRGDALDDVKNTSLIEEKEKNRERNGVVEARVQAVQPGTPIEIRREADDRITHIVVVANDPDRCARMAVRVKELDDRQLRVTIGDDRCVKVTK